MSLDNLHDLLTLELQDLYDADQTLTSIAEGLLNKKADQEMPVQVP